MRALFCLLGSALMCSCGTEAADTPNAALAMKVVPVRSHGDGTFQTRIDYTPKYAVKLSSKPMLIRDFNNDRKLDFASTNYDANTMSIWLGNGDGTFGTRTDYDTGIGPYSILVGDFNKDSKNDLLIVNSNRGNSTMVSVLLGN